MAKKAQEQAFSSQKDNFLYILQRLFFIPVYNVKFRKPDFISGLKYQFKISGGTKRILCPPFFVGI